MKKIFWLMLLFIITVLLSWYYGISNYLTLSALQAQSSSLKTMVNANYALSIIVYNLLYTGLIACGIPIVAPLSIMGGFLFGLFFGFFFSLGSTLAGCLIYFFMARYALVHFMRNHYIEKIDVFNTHIARYGYTYLLTLHFLTIVPFFVINTLAAFANVPLWHFVWTTIVGCTPIIFIYVLAGNQLSTLQSIHDILKIEMLLILLLLALLALAPMIIRSLRERMHKNS